MNAPEDALAWLCAAEQWKYKEYSKALYALEENKKWLENTNIERSDLAAKNWLNKAVFEKCMAEWRYVDKIKSDMAEWDRLWLQWTPSVYANWNLINFNSEESFFKILDQLIAN